MFSFNKNNDEKNDQKENDQKENDQKENDQKENKVNDKKDEELEQESEIVDCDKIVKPGSICNNECKDYVECMKQNNFDFDKCFEKYELFTTYCNYELDEEK